MTTGAIHIVSPILAGMQNPARKTTSTTAQARPPFMFPVFAGFCIVSSISYLPSRNKRWKLVRYPFADTRHGTSCAYRHAGMLLSGLRPKPLPQFRKQSVPEVDPRKGFLWGEEGETQERATARLPR